MKWAALALIIAAAPALAFWLRTRPRQAPLLWGLLTFLPFVVGPWNLDVAPFATATWSGYVKGWEISLLDAVAFGVVFGTRGRWPRIWMIIPFLFYVFAVLLSVLQAHFPNYAMSYAIQLMRVTLIFVAVARVAINEDGERALLTGLVAGLVVQAAYAIWAKLNGAVQTGGSLGHQNLLGFVSHMVVLPAFALLLGGRWTKISALGLVAGAIVVILGASRATIGLAGAGLLLTMLLSMAIRFTSRKLAVAGLGLLLIGVAGPLALGNLNNRMEVQGSGLTFLQADQERFAFARAARDMIASEPLGVGANHYVFVANTEGYSERAGVGATFGNRSANVHNVYLLIWAETGYLGITAYIILLTSSLLYTFVTAIRYRKTKSAEVLIGIGAALVITSIHSFVEWVAILNPCQSLFAAMVGLSVGLRSRLAAQAKASLIKPNVVQRPDQSCLLVGQRLSS